jgi:hypothetical protein
MERRRAEEFCHSYGAASIQGDAIGIAGHYGFPFTAFTLGDVSTFDDREEANRRVTSHLERFAAVGLGTAIGLQASEIVPVSERLALCHLTWEIRPADGTPPWTWTNVYALREAADAGLYFEASFADNEITGLLERFPEFFTL